MVGITINEYQVQRATYHNEKQVCGCVVGVGMARSFD